MEGGSNGVQWVDELLAVFKNTRLRREVRYRYVLREYLQKVRELGFKVRRATQYTVIKIYDKRVVVFVPDNLDSYTPVEVDYIALETVLQKTKTYITEVSYEHHD